ncbi:MAG: flagellar basal body-associated FliL family protein [Proteobacteria bacterium]|nr:flagellar basal body-associated FliL family protein [Pseudomonadota bacterium]MDA0895652.1 flagellar basal body-associated FliL family protein [Pseudomonadota bacterium]MDA1244914.1 flagellar basal body-associated FliL family protein [Pseudomonadota bacterium]
MSEEVAAEGEAKAKKPWLLIIGIIFGVIILTVGTVIGTLFATGFFSQEDQLQAELAQIEEGEAEGEGEGEEEAVVPELLETPNPSRLETLYYQMPAAFTANLANSRKVMQISITVMTHYDQLVIDNVTKHEPSIRAAILARLSIVDEQQSMAPDFRSTMAEELRLVINSELEAAEDFGGIEKVLFTEFLMQ